MRCMPRIISRAEVDQGITQRDQFNTDEFRIEETLIREPHQNSLDGRSQYSTGPVHTRIRLVEPIAANAPYWKALLEPLRPHLEASKLDLRNIDLGMPRILLIEDFGTTGLIGAFNDKDELNFSDFWRRFGLSHKKGGEGGRWGLGKLVFSSASAIGTLFGLTVRDSDPNREPILMGQAILNNHRIGAVDYAPHVFFAVPDTDGFQLPERDIEKIQAFARATGISRTNEPGLSIAVICLRDGLEPDRLLPHVITNFFFPILTDRLVVEIDNKTVNNGNFDELAKAHGGPSLADGFLIKFIRSVDTARKLVPAFNLKTEWSKDGVRGALGEAQIETLRAAYATGELVCVRAPIQLRRKNGTTEATYVDSFLQRTPDLAQGQALFVRGSITIPGEARSFRGRKSFGALLASETTIMEFLGDSENPSHTRWVGSADKLKENWMTPGENVAAIKRLLNDLNDLATETDKRVDESALIEFFSIPKPATLSEKLRPKSHPTPVSPLPPTIPATPRAFNVTPRPGGFVIKGNPLAATPVPYQIRIATAYGVRRGNAFKKHKRQDFDLRGTTGIRTIATGASWAATESNVVLVDISANDFRFEVAGFDTERDLELDVRR